LCGVLKKYYVLVAPHRLETLVILLTGGTKKRQQRDIDAAIGHWQDYKRSKRARL